MTNIISTIFGLSRQATDKPHKRGTVVSPFVSRIKIYANLMIVPLLLLAVWQILSGTGLLLEVVLPSPWKVLMGLRSIILDGTLGIDLRDSGIRVLVGYFWGVLIGLSLGLASGLSKFVERLVGPVVDVLRQIPLYAWIPLIILWFGIGEMSKYVIIAKSVFIPVFVNTLQGIRGVSKDYIEVSQVLELRYFKLLSKVVLPSALPSIFTGLRLGAGFAWMAVVAAEMLGGLTGIGYGLLQAKDFLQSDKLIALMLVIGLVGFLVDRVLKVAESSVLHWRKGFSGEK
ncbi:ABC transporter permease [Clostridium sp. KNHs216]|uniref:ABC transporter permease n=1 Tax=Clostridium sp. KNHs216 TaxID=1550235 RepID=UPI00114D819C|nr:ABC transporter permease [Clostridium sp. KNHs216]TQI66825.1 sulfonate transport system permease protein [Clostridium sp. KNHs216]